MRGESGQNEFLRGPFALFEAHSRAKFVRNLIKHGWASISPPELIPPPSPGQGFAGDGRLRRRFSHTGHGPFRALILSNLKWGGPCRGHYVLPQADLKSSAILSSRRIVGISYFPYTEALSGSDKVCPPHLRVSQSAAAAPNHDSLPLGRKTHIHTPPPRPLA